MTDPTPDASAFRGVLPALVTPMHPDGQVHWAALAELVERVVEGGVHGVVPCGTTGESATLTAEEQRAVIARVVEVVNGQVPVLAGPGATTPGRPPPLPPPPSTRGRTACCRLPPTTTVLPWPASWSTTVRSPPLPPAGR